MVGRPGTYSEWGNRGLSFKHTFGGRVQLNLAVDLKCVDINTDVCLSCNKQPIGDYWHRNNKEFLCDDCMAQKRRTKADCKRYHLSQFRVRLQIYKTVRTLLVEDSLML